MTRYSMHARIFRSIFDGKEVICHRLVRELVNERDDGVHRAVGHDQRRALPTGILFLFPRTREPTSASAVLECECTNAPESLDSRACIHLALPGPQTPAPVTAPRLPRPRTGVIDRHAPGSCASAANSPVGAPLHGCSRADEAHRGARGVRGRNIECKEIHLTLCTRLRSACPTQRVPRVSEEWKRKGEEEEWKHTDFATKRISSVSLSRSARAVPSDRGGLYMLKKYSGTCNEKICDSIAKMVM